MECIFGVGEVMWHGNEREAIRSSESHRALHCEPWSDRFGGRAGVDCIEIGQIDSCVAQAILYHRARMGAHAVYGNRLTFSPNESLGLNRHDYVSVLDE